MIVVTAYKQSGKFYSRQETPLKDMHYVACLAVQPRSMPNDTYKRLIAASYDAIQVLKNGIEENSDNVSEYSGLTCGFHGSYYYTIEVMWDDSEYGHCLYHIDRSSME